MKVYLVGFYNNDLFEVEGIFTKEESVTEYVRIGFSVIEIPLDTKLGGADEHTRTLSPTMLQ